MRPQGINRSAIGLLRVLMAASLLLPLLMFVGAAWLNYAAAIREADTELQHSSEVAREQATKVFDSQSQVADRVNDLLRGMDAAEIRRSEEGLHEAFARIVSRLPQIQGVLLVGRDGHPLISADVFPVPADTDLSGHDYVRAVLGGYSGTYVSSLQFGEISRRAFFGLARPWIGPEGQVSGVIVVAVLPTAFEDFYRVLVDEGGSGRAGRVNTLVRDDGQLLVRYPPLPGPLPIAPRNGPFFTAIRQQPDFGTYESRSIVDRDAPDRLFAYRRVQGYPIYVVAGRNRSVVIAGWRNTMASHLLFGIPATVALFSVAWTALVRTRREEEALARANQEIIRREEAEAALLRAQRLEAVGQMTGGVAHDFNNLLTVILGSAEMLGKRAEDPTRVRRIAQQIMLATRRGSEITQQLLAFSRRQVVHPETLNINRCLRDFEPLLHRAARESIMVELDLAADLDAVRLDPGHFEAAILNLVGNARDAMPEGGCIRIATRNATLAGSPDLAAGNYISVSVSDTGTGMAADTAARAFEPFFTTKGVGQGTGLGLSQVYGFVKQAGGDVRIVSAPGAGTTVELLLPRSEAPLAGHAPDTDPMLLCPAKPGEVVLVAEDEPGVLEIATESLRDLGYEVITATTAQEALDRLRSQARIDVLFSDVVMPGGMNGIQLAAEARLLRPELKVLLTSGYTGRPDRPPADDIPLLTKPYDREQLASQLRAVLQR